jgi:hypothetical protein
MVQQISAMHNSHKKLTSENAELKVKLALLQAKYDKLQSLNNTMKINYFKELSLMRTQLEASQKEDDKTEAKADEIKVENTTTVRLLNVTDGLDAATAQLFNDRLFEIKA